MGELLGLDRFEDLDALLGDRIEVGLVPLALGLGLGVGFGLGR